MEEKITKHNVCQHIEGLLKKMRVGYALESSYEDMSIYKIHATSLNNIIQVEFDESEDFLIQFVVSANEYTSALYEYVWESNVEGQDDIEQQIEALIEESRKFSKGLQKIKKLVEGIRDTCDEYDLYVGDFIEVCFNFDEI